MRSEGITNNNRTSLVLKLLIIIFISFISFNGVRLIHPETGFGDTIHNVSTMFFSIILEALPFILLGSFISSVIQLFVSEEKIAEVLPKNKLLGVIAAASLGLVFPVCECAIVPITRSLIKKGIPLNMAVTFMLAVPIINPITLMSTYYAFYTMPVMVLIRAGGGLLAAVTVGLTIGWLEEGETPLKQKRRRIRRPLHRCGCGCEECRNEIAETGILNKVLKAASHTAHEFCEVLVYLIFGALISSMFQVFVSRSYFIPEGYDKSLSILIMICFAYLLSLCSEADAFIARTFLGQFSTGSIAAFLIFGPMLDIKNTLMLGNTFIKKVLAELVVIIIIVCFIAGSVINRFYIQ